MSFTRKIERSCYEVTTQLQQRCYEVGSVKDATCLTSLPAPIHEGIHKGRLPTAADPPLWRRREAPPPLCLARRRRSLATAGIWSCHNAHPVLPQRMPCLAAAPEIVSAQIGDCVLPEKRFLRLARKDMVCHCRANPFLQRFTNA